MQSIEQEGKQCAVKPVVIIQNIGPVDIVRIRRVSTFAYSKKNTNAVSYGGKNDA